MKAMRKKLQKQSFAVFFKIVILKIFANLTGKHPCWSQFYKEETPTQVLFCGICYIFKSTFFYRIPSVATSETKYIHASAANLLHIRIGNLDWCKCGHCKNEARKIDCLCCREVDVTLIASAKIPKREGSISPCSIYRQLPDYQLHLLST